MSVSEATAFVLTLFRADNTSGVIMAGDAVRKVGSSEVGIVQFIAQSPYYGEKVQRAYVEYRDDAGKLVSTDYLLEGEISLVK